MADPAVIELRGVSKAFGATQALSGISFTSAVSSGTIVAVWGANGAGKSTLLSIIGGIFRPDTGTVSLFGSRPNSREFRRKYRPAFLLQDSFLYGDLTVAQNLDLAACLAAADNQDVATLIRRFEIEPVLDRPVRECSPGMAKRASIVRALLARPRIALIDEPYSSVDMTIQDRITAQLSDLRKSGCTVFLATHRFDIVRQLADRVIVLFRGRLSDDIDLTGSSREALTVERLNGGERPQSAAGGAG